MIASVPAIALAERDLDDFRAEAARNEWRLSKSDKLHQIKVSFRVEAMLDAPLDVVARVQADVDSYIRWYFAVLEVKLLKKVSDKEFIFYMVHDAPIGTPDRDVILKATIEPMTTKKPFVVVKMTSIPDYAPARPPYVRMTAENYVVKLTPQGKDKTLLESEGFIDPGGTAPSWAVNFVQGKGPYTNMMGMQRMINLPQFRDAKTPLPYTFVE
jgi:hypothetical protein